MANKKVAIILINFKDYAEKFLADCIESIRSIDYEDEVKLFIVDNKTSGESYLFLSKIAPKAEIILNKENDGFAKGNNDAMKLAIRQGYEYIFLLNMDTVVEKNCLKELIKVIDEDKKIGAVQARLMMWPNKEIINSLGNETHFLGFGYCAGYKKDIAFIRPEPGSLKNIFYPSGAAVLFKADILKETGLFDEKFWMYNEDQDLGWRIWLAGYRCVLAPKAIVYHKYEFSRSASKYYWLDRNRIIVILKNYHYLTLLLIFPAFVIMEIGLILFSIKSGWFKEKIKVWGFFFNPLNWIYLLRARREAQRGRKIKDKIITKMITGKIWYQEVDDIKLRIINPIFDLYWRVVRTIVFW